MRQYCSVCKDYLDMEVVAEGNEEEVTWLKCPQCKGILPRVQLADEEEPVAAVKERFSAAALAGADVVEYEAHRQYEIGSVIYHRSWNDYGKVIDKIELPGARRAIRVQFLNQGDVNLLENVHETS